MGITHQKYKVACVQAAPRWLDLDGSVDKAIALIEEAAANGARLIAFPETFIPGYPWYIWMGSPAWTVGRGFVQRYFDNSLSYASPQAERLRVAVQRAGITAVVGLSERDGGSLYIAQWIIGPEGETVAKRRKLRPTHGERTVFGDGDGSHIAVHDRADVGRLGALCCWEHLQPLTKYAMYSQNEQVHVAAWPSFSPTFAASLGAAPNLAASRVYALEGSCFVLASCAIVSPEMLDELCDTPDKRELILPGGAHSTIYGPDGIEISERLPEDQEGIVYAEIDLGLISIAKNAADPAGHYARPDVTRLLFNNRPSRPVEYFAPPAEPAAAASIVAAENLTGVAK